MLFLLFLVLNIEEQGYFIINDYDEILKPIFIYYSPYNNDIVSFFIIDFYVS